MRIIKDINMFIPRDYQLDAARNCALILKNGGNPLAILATGTGKTEIAGMLINKISKANKRTLFIAHRGLLLDQADQKLYKHTGIFPSREQGNMKANWDSLIVTASVQSLQNDRLKTLPKDLFDYIFIDECHRAVATSYQNIFNHFNKAQRIGITATADRPDGKPLNPTFSKIAIQYSISKAIRDGHLCKIIGRKVSNFDIDLSSIKVAGNDYSDDDVANVIEKYLTPIAHNIKKETIERKKVLLFMPDVESAKLISETMVEMGLSADYVSGERKNNNSVLADFNSGKIKYLASCMLLIEGYDEPAIDCVVMLRPTLSRVVYSQAIGRGTRKHFDKENLLLLEFTYNSNKLKLVTAFELIAGSIPNRIVEEAEKNTSKDVDFLEVLDNCYSEHYSIRGIVERAFVKDYGFRSFNPFDIGDISGIDLSDETEAWFNGHKLKGKITQNQKSLLDRYMIESDGMSKAQASALIDHLRNSGHIPMIGKASSSQITYLKSLYPGKEFPQSISKAAASMLISETKKGVNRKWTE